MKERQVSFAGGELAPALWGRTDLNRYPVGAKTIKNFIVTPHGVLVNRPGTQHIAIIDDVGLFGTDIYYTRLIPFREAGTDGVVLLFGYDYISIVGPDSTDPRHAFSFSANAVETSFSGKVDKLNFAQVGKIMTLCKENPGSNSAPYELTRDDAGDFSIDTVNFISVAYPRYQSSVAPFTTDNDRPAVQIEGSWSPTQAPSDLYPPTGPSYDPGDPESDPTLYNELPRKEWKWYVSRVMQRADGTLYETRAFPVTETVTLSGGSLIFADLQTAVSVYPTWPQRLRLGIVAPGTSQKGHTTGDDDLFAYRVYRGREGLFGLVGQTNGQYFNDDGGLPNYSDPPRASYLPYYPFGGVFQYPSVVGFLGNRRYFGGTQKRRSGIWASAVGQWDVFDVVPIPDDADSLNFDIVTERPETIRAMVARKQLIVFTSGGIHVVSGSGQDEVITPTSIADNPVSEDGCKANVPVVPVGTRVFFAHAKGGLPYMLALGEGKEPTADVSLLSRHLFDSAEVVDWAYAKFPYSVLWVVLSDGSLLSLTYVLEQDVLAWARHEIAGGGLVERVAVNHEDNEDGVYLVVKYPGIDKRFLERLAYRQFSDQRHAIFLDRSVSHNGLLVPTSGYAMTVSAVTVDGAIGDTVTLTFAASVSSQISVGDVIQVDEDEANGDEDDDLFGHPYRFLVTVDLGSDQFTAQVLTRDTPSWMVGFAELENVFRCVSVVSGLDHLDGQTVKAYADGVVIPDLVVQGGAVSFGEDDSERSNFKAIAHVGLSYNSDFVSLAAIQEKGKQKTCGEAAVELEYTRGGYVGPDLDHLYEVPTRQVSDGLLPQEPTRVDAKVNIPSQWAESAVVAFRQSDPLPVTLLGITREISYGGR